MRQAETNGGRQILGVEYYTLTEVAVTIGVARQTLWRWRRDSKIPTGRRSHDRTILYSAAEVAAIRDFVNHLEPVSLSVNPRQGNLFGRPPRGAR